MKKSRSLGILALALLGLISLRAGGTGSRGAWRQAGTWQAAAAT